MFPSTTCCCNLLVSIFSNQFKLNYDHIYKYSFLSDMDLEYIFELVQLEVLYTIINEYSGVELFFNDTEIDLFNKTAILIYNIVLKITIKIHELEYELGFTTTTVRSSTGFSSSFSKPSDNGSSSSFYTTTTLLVTSNTLPTFTLSTGSESSSFARTTKPFSYSYSQYSSQNSVITRKELHFCAKNIFC